MAGGRNDRFDNEDRPESWDDRADDPADATPETQRLALDDNDKLPWLQSDDDDLEDYRPSGTGRLIGMAVAGLLVLAALVGGIWWLTHRATDGDVLADGSTIKAPAGDYKVAPDDPGGKIFAGTGDSSFGVAVGQNRPARLGEQPPVEAPSEAAPTTAAASPSASASPSPSASPAAVGGVGVQIGAYSSRESADAAWQRVSAQHEALSGYSHRVVEGRADIGTVYRLQAVTGNLAEANGLCARLKSGGLPCQVKR